MFLAEVESINHSRIKKSMSYSSSRIEVEELLPCSLSVSVLQKWKKKRNKLLLLHSNGTPLSICNINNKVHYELSLSHSLSMPPISSPLYDINASFFALITVQVVSTHCKSVHH
ncbi:hypothetical protein SDJN02_24635, partial [Cucurbita argyrosperma subsp. argyrosperma]